MVADDTRSHRRYKTTKASVEYTPHGTEAEHCGGCVHFIAPNKCRVVLGDVKPEGWCRRWRAKK